MARMLKDFEPIMEYPVSLSRGWPKYWSKRPFVPCRILFPRWKTAEPMLEEFCNKTKGWIIEEGAKLGMIELHLDWPKVRDEATGKEVYMQNTFPDEEKPLFGYILWTTLADYSYEATEPFIGEVINERLRIDILQALYAKERDIMEAGGKSVIDELRFRLGV